MANRNWAWHSSYFFNHPGCTVQVDWACGPAASTCLPLLYNLPCWPLSDEIYNVKFIPYILVCYILVIVFLDYVILYLHYWYLC